MGGGWSCCLCSLNCKQTKQGSSFCVTSKSTLHKFLLAVFVLAPILSWRPQPLSCSLPLLAFFPFPIIILVKQKGNLCTIWIMLTTAYLGGLGFSAPPQQLLTACPFSEEHLLSLPEEPVWPKSWKRQKGCTGLTAFSLSVFSTPFLWERLVFCSSAWLSMWIWPVEN